MAVGQGDAESQAQFSTTSLLDLQISRIAALALISLAARFGYGSGITAAQGTPTTRLGDASPIMLQLFWLTELETQETV
jgi:hypothetical protein